MTDPRSDVVVTESGGHLSIAIPGGAAHDLWTGVLLAPRVLQNAPNTDFTVEVKFDAPLTSQYQFQGILAHHPLWFAPEPATVSVTVYTILGQEVARLTDGYQQAGTYEVIWDGRPTLLSRGALSSGVYLCRMVATASSGKSFVATKRMVLMK